ncbi:MAG: hypothetical protein KAU01_11405 [Candidatus Cloacimonetes bacterium]|nr:hypothetical protein [Candidatus Cloacimonadota bacterium]
MEPKEIKQKLESSFSPYRCVAEISEFEDRIQFRVFNENNETIITSPEIKIYEDFHVSSLIPIIKKAKDEIKKKNYVID